MPDHRHSLLCPIQEVGDRIVEVNGQLGVDIPTEQMPQSASCMGQPTLGEGGGGQNSLTF